MEYAPYQAVPKKKVKKDPKIGTILEGVHKIFSFPFWDTRHVLLISSQNTVQACGKVIINFAS